jgi:hypothetical protein
MTHMTDEPGYVERHLEEWQERGYNDWVNKVLYTPPMVAGDEFDAYLTGRVRARREHDETTSTTQISEHDNEATFICESCGAEWKMMHESEDACDL